MTSGHPVTTRKPLVSTASISDDHLVVDIYVSFMHVLAELIVVIKRKTRLMHVQACL